MKIHYIMHAPFEKLGAIESWADRNSHQITGTHTYKNEKLPSVESFDLLVIMGGPQSPLELDKFPYLRDEIALASSAIRANKAVWGACLGAQIIAEALGAKTERSPYKEVGVYPIELTTAAETDPLFKLFPKQFPVMHWHNDMPGIPTDAVLLAKSAGCPQQAFRYSDRVYGFQFHLEMNQELVKGMIENCPHDLQSSPYTRTEAELLASDFASINKKMDMTLDYLASLVS